ncbi:MAG: hypothetical protein KAT04_00005 [Methylococcales bacterium]|nr:hypothetical protein [Methylococcales bacterium]
MDAGGRATHGAVAEEKPNNSLLQNSFKFDILSIHQTKAVRALGAIGSDRIQNSYLSINILKGIYIKPCKIY